MGSVLIKSETPVEHFFPNQTCNLPHITNIVGSGLRFSLIYLEMTVRCGMGILTNARSYDGVVMITVKHFPWRLGLILERKIHPFHYSCSDRTIKAPASVHRQKLLVLIWKMLLCFFEGLLHSFQGFSKSGLNVFPCAF